MFEIIEVVLLAFTIFSEALHESTIGKYTVASAIHNRVADPAFPKTYSEVVLQRRQFSCYDSFDLIIGNIAKIEHRKTEWIASVIIAVAFVNGDAKPNVKAKHYTRIETKRIWMKDMIIEKIVDNHKYLVEK
jgi:spore germination cell wall hydrolase CwlJ-like protein